jgi:hypothetical protein
MITAKQVLIEARDLLINVGWTQGTMCKFSKDGNPQCYCSLGAIFEAMRRIVNPYDHDRMKDIIVSLMRQVIKEKKTYSMSVVNFNDSSIRTKEEVIDAFNTAIERA